MLKRIFGFLIDRDLTEVQPDTKPVIGLPTEAADDGAAVVQSNAHYGTYIDLEGAVRNEFELVSRYREMANHPELEMAIEEINNEAIVRDDFGRVITLNLDKLEVSESIKKKIQEEFSIILKLLNFKNLAEDIFKRWYIDGRLNYQIVVDKEKPHNGIEELRYIDPRKIRKIREIIKDKDPVTGAMIIKSMSEYYVYNDQGSTTQHYTSGNNQGIKIAPDSILNVNSGLMDAKNTFVISYLHSAIKPLNQLRMIEDAMVIYRLSRSTEKIIFYIDVGNLPKGKAEQYLHNVMVKYRNKVVYEASTGQLKDDRKHISLQESFFLPRREGGKGTEITTLPAGPNLSDIEDIKYFRNKLLNSLKVPISRLEPQEGGMIGIGRTTEVTRDEIKFAKFIDKLRNKFTRLFDNALEIQLTLKGICTRSEWQEFKEDISYTFLKDNNFTELKESELIRERLTSLSMIDPYIGKYYSNKWVRRNILRQTDEEITEEDKKIKEEEKLGITSVSQDQNNEGEGENEINPEDYPPEDNVSDNDEVETITPSLDQKIDKYSKIINNRS